MTASTPGKALEVRGVSKSFGGVRALQDVSFLARPGAVTALIGPNGAGKSTLANVISGFTSPDAGAVLLDGADITRQKAHRRADLGIARTFQNLEVFSGMTVLENVMLGAYSRANSSFAGAMLGLPTVAREERTSRAISRSALEDVDLTWAAGRPVESLAFGQAKLVELARALVLQPSVLLLDEPAAGLTPGEAHALGERIVGLAERGVTVLLIEHNMKLVMEFSHAITVLAGGAVIAHGDPAAVQNDPTVIEAYLGRGFDRPGEPT